MHYLAGSRGGRVHPLWRDPKAKQGNISDGLLEHLTDRLDGEPIDAGSLFAYIAGVVAHPGYVAAFRDDLRHATEIRVPLTADRGLFNAAVKVGQRVLWLHTYGKRFAEEGATPPTRVQPDDSGPYLGKSPIPTQVHSFSHDLKRNKLIVSGTNDDETKQVTAHIHNVSAAVYNYTVGDMNVLSVDRVECNGRYRLGEHDAVTV